MSTERASRAGPGSTRSLARNSVVRFAADLTNIAVGAVGAVVTARWLGPADKGTFSTITFVIAVVSLLCTLGLGDAAIVELNSGRRPLRQVLATTFGAVTLAALSGAAVTIALMVGLFSRSLPHLLVAILVAAATVPISAFATVFSQVLNAAERIILTSLVALLTGLVTMTALALFLIVADWSIAGAVAASLVGSSVGVLVLAAALGGDRKHLRPSLDRAYLRRALPYGLRVQGSYMAVTFAARLDLLLVYLLAGHAPAGRYSIALTISTLASYGGFAMIYAGFPRLASLDEESASVLLTRITRSSLAAALMITVVLGCTSPFVIPMVFGSAYRGALLPTLLLLPGSILFAGQFVLARGSAARGNARLLVRSFVTSVVVMVAFDLLAIPQGGSPAAAIGSTLGAAAGFGVALGAVPRRRIQALRDVAPQPRDGVELIRRVVGLAFR